MGTPTHLTHSLQNTDLRARDMVCETKLERLGQFCTPVDIACAVDVAHIWMYAGFLIHDIFPHHGKAKDIF